VKWNAPIVVLIGHEISYPPIRTLKSVTFQELRYCSLI